jgi:hypothetical protein
MALPSSGVLTLNDIQTEFGGTNPIDLSDYYRGGGLVPDSGPNAAIPTSGAISVSDFYGSANLLTLDFLTHGTGGNGSSISIGTARSTRIVHLSGYTTNGVFPTSVTIGGISASLIKRQGAASTSSGQPGSVWQAWAIVPTGTTATVSVSTACVYYIATFNTVNGGSSGTGTAAGVGGSSSTFTFTVANPGVVFWGGTTTEPAGFVGGANSLSTSSPGGVTYYLFRSGQAQLCMGYNITSTANSRTFTMTYATGKIGGAGACASMFRTN